MLRRRGQVCWEGGAWNTDTAHRKEARAMMGYYGGWGMLVRWFAGVIMLLVLVAVVVFFAWAARKPS